MIDIERAVMIDLQEFVAQKLREAGYDGLVSEYLECSCLIDDLMPCGEPSPRCVPGHKIRCDPETCENGGCDEWHVAPGPR